MSFHLEIIIIVELLLVMHNNGKKHQRLQRAREARKASTERSIYVCGFENTITLEWDLNDYFSKFGKVAGVFIDKEKVGYRVSYSVSFFQLKLEIPFSRLRVQKSLWFSQKAKLKFELIAFRHL